ncbi:hypothetical protein F6X40_21805 [Paraburkholderia sp. UCT31]|uniref:hypothetical protein n=1 Tax=Paraburkholderia sp. UCT31 TaxID=2615209 RepID=UPI001654E88E|nr:hypothetical protein [Paraburkholderia sp. UCT31]MBC8739381.1 hypothetical protein [Paraburkholderia sp. UCT31]
MAYILAWVEAHPGLAAWVQAVGTIIAMFIAIAVPAFQITAARRQARRDAAASFRSTAQIALLGLGLVQTANKEVQGADGGCKYFASDYRRFHFMQILDLLDRVNTQVLPTPDAVIAFVSARRHIAECVEWIDCAIQESANPKGALGSVREELRKNQMILVSDVQWLLNESYAVERGEDRWSERVKEILTVPDSGT